jgi:hypothetical protein
VSPGNRKSGEWLETIVTIAQGTIKVAEYSDFIEKMPS